MKQRLRRKKEDSLLNKVLLSLRESPEGLTQADLVKVLGVPYERGKQDAPIIRATIKQLRAQGHMIIDHPVVNPLTGTTLIKKYQLVKSSKKFYDWFVKNAVETGYRVRRGRPTIKQAV
jgi:hypothetical protein